MHRRDISMGLFGAAAAATFVAAESRAQTCTPPCYAEILAETHAGIPSAAIVTQYLPGDVRRYGAVMDGSTPDNQAWQYLAAVMQQGVDGYAPPMPTLITQQITITLSSTLLTHVSLFGYGCTIYTTGAISALMVTTQNNASGASIYGLTHNNSKDGLATAGFVASNCNNCNFIDCNIVVNGNVSSSVYAGVLLTTSSGAFSFWNRVINLATSYAGSGAHLAPFGVLLMGACNATIIRDCSFESVNYGVGLDNSTSGNSAQTSLANGVVVDGCAFEGCVSSIFVNGNSVSGVAIDGLRITNNRSENPSGNFLQFDYLSGAGSATFLSGNYIVAGGYVGQNNVSGLIVPISSFDSPNTRGSVTISGTATSANVTFLTSEPSTSYFVTLGSRIGSGAPPDTSLQAYYSSVATTGFTINLAAAPGVSNSIVVNWILVR
jgi:hypothetical protein